MMLSSLNLLFRIRASWRHTHLETSNFSMVVFLVEGYLKLIRIHAKFLAQILLLIFAKKLIIFFLV